MVWKKYYYFFRYEILDKGSGKTLHSGNGVMPCIENPFNAFNNLMGSLNEDYKDKDRDIFIDIKKFERIK